MASSRTTRLYALLMPTEALLAAYARNDREGVRRYIVDAILGGTTSPGALRIVDLPNYVPKDAPTGKAAPTGKDPPTRKDGPTGDEAREAFRPLLTVSLHVDLELVGALRARVAEAGDGKLIVALGSDLPVYITRHWCPSDENGPAFGTRASADRLIRADALAKATLTGAGVNVVMVDAGFDKTKVKHFGGGWAGGLHPPGTTPSGHGVAMVRQVLSLAPEATLFDYAVLPPRITNLAAFLSKVTAGYQDLQARMAAGSATSRWIVVNSWSVFDRQADVLGHVDGMFDPLNLEITRTVALGADIVFAAGNCGQFCPDQRCGRLDRGPGASVIGANAHPDVLTVGAVRTDALWLGYSSQGPGQFEAPAGQPEPANEKPDLCAPSEFREAHDSAILNTGTSTACALSAGAMACLREGPAAGLSPAAMKALLIANTTRIAGPGWDLRVGHGILNARAALAAASGAVAPV